ncbi:MAG: OPT/YSL family transporter [Halanaerobiales bacterium]
MAGQELPEKHPSAFNPPILITNIILAAIGAIIGMEMITRVGIATNTSVVGALVAIIIARIPLRLFKQFTEINNQNLLQTGMSGGTFAAANSLLLPIGIPWLLGYPELTIPMLIGASVALIIDATMIYWMFDSPVFPGEFAWPPGIAAAEAIKAAAKKGKQGLMLVIGIVGGVTGTHFGIPMDLLGISWIGNIWALTMFGIGLIVSGEKISKSLFGLNIGEIYLPHGIMIGAGLVALYQIIRIMTSDDKGSESLKQLKTTVSNKEMSTSMGKGISLFLVVALFLAIISGLLAHMSAGKFVLWIIFAAIAAILSELFVGLSAMHAGWFPAFATALIFLVLGMFLGFPPVPLAILVGFTATTGPAFADMGYDLKAGWILRGEGKYPEFEKEGRKQQYFSELISFVVAIAVVAFAHEFYFNQGLFAPVNRAYVATIEAGVNPEIIRYLIYGAIPGAIVQFIGGPARQLGVLFATGALIANPVGGVTVLVGILIRIVVIQKYGEEGQNSLYVLGAGSIAGAALYNFFTDTLSITKDVS